MGHTVEKCWEPGGGSAGKAPDWFRNAKAKKNGSGETQRKQEKANAAVDDNSADSGSESCAFLHDISICTAGIQGPFCSVDWNNSPPQTDIIAAATSQLYYFFDLGATSHCSPDHADFSVLHLIPTRQVRGINGSTISTVAIGDIHLKCGKGRRLILTDALYIPDANLRLISIGCLGDVGLKASFNATQCNILRGSKTIAQGMRQGTGLY